jgi:hypothetical protein
MTPATYSYLQQIAKRTGLPTRLQLVRKIMADDPLGFFKELRAHKPILALPECTLVALYDDVIEMLNMPNTYSRSRCTVRKWTAT